MHGNNVQPLKCHFVGAALVLRTTTHQVLFLHKAELGFFHFLEIVTGWLVPSAGQKIPLAENTKEKSRQCFT
jgi:hypothetical protein